jgi:hypothetical protein
MKESLKITDIQSVYSAVRTEYLCNGDIHRFVVKGINCFILTQELELITDISGALTMCKLQFCCLVRFSLKKILLLSNIQVIAMVRVFCLISYPCVSYIHCELYAVRSSSSCPINTLHSITPRHTVCVCRS